MEYVSLFIQLIVIFIAIIIVGALLLYYLGKWTEYFTKLKLYGYYTNGVYVWQLIQYDKVQATLLDVNENRLIIMGMHEFLRDFNFLMSDTLSGIELVEEKKES